VKAIEGTNQSSLSPPSTADATGSSKLGKDEFVRLLLTQLSHQDPTSPQDSAAFVAQLAQFAGIEIAQQQSALLEALLVAETASNQMAVTGLVGKDVTVGSSSIELADGQAREMIAHLDAPAAEVTVVIKDEHGNTVRTVRLGAQPEGDVPFTWDGRSDDGSLLPDGKYSVEIVANAQDGSAINVTTRQQARVIGVSFDDGVPRLLLEGGGSIALSEVAEVREPDSQATRRAGDPGGLLFAKSLQAHSAEEETP
jgi:flagellar basal-body rod modification protein FlgD